MKKLWFLIGLILIGCATAKAPPPTPPPVVKFQAYPPLPTGGITGPQFATAIDNRFNGVVEIDPLLGSTTSLVPGGYIPPLNPVVNANNFSGADIGAKVNNAMAAIPNGGVVEIPAGNYSFSTTIQCPVTASIPYIIRGVGRSNEGGSAPTGHGTRLLYTGSGDAINQFITNPAFEQAIGCEIRDLTLDGSGATSAAVGLHFGGTFYQTVDNVQIQNFAGFSIFMEDAASMYTERYRIRGSILSLSGTAVGIRMIADSLSQSSFDYGVIDIFAAMNAPANVIFLSGAGSGTAIMEGAKISIRGNFGGSTTSGQGTFLFAMSGTAIVTHTEFTLAGECDGGSSGNPVFCGAFYVFPGNLALGGTFYNYLVSPAFSTWEGDPFASVVGMQGDALDGYGFQLRRITFAGLAALTALRNGEEYYCSNCDPPLSPPVVCTSSGAKTGSWVHVINNTLRCVW